MFYSLNTNFKLTCFCNGPRKRRVYQSYGNTRSLTNPTQVRSRPPTAHCPLPPLLIPMHGGRILRRAHVPLQNVAICYWSQSVTKLYTS